MVFLLVNAISGCCFSLEDDSTVFSEMPENKVIMVVADYLSIEDLYKMKFMGNLIEVSNCALMNNRQTGKASPRKSKLIIGSGKRLELKGKDINIEKIKEDNNNSGYLEYIGYLGDDIRNNGGTVCYLGNADTEEQDRSSVLIAIDSKGTVDYSRTEGILLKDQLFPYGTRTDYKKLAELYKQYLPASSLMVIETGDMERLESFRGSMSKGAYESCKSAIIGHIDSFMKEIADYDGSKTIIFISTYPSREASAGNNKLTPVVIHEAEAGGLLYSENTRREGIILNTDLADYILVKLGYAKVSAIKEAVKVDPGEILVSMNRNIVRTSLLRAPVLTSYAVMVIITLVMFLLATLFFRSRNRGFMERACSFFAYTMLSYPISLLYIKTSYREISLPVYMIFTIAASAMLSLILQSILKDKIKVIFSICTLLIAGLTIDIIAGSPLIKQSVLGYDPIIGARFYGIGNEYAGVFAGCSLMAAGCLMELMGKKPKGAVVAFYFLNCAAILGLTFMGANFGGALAAAVGYVLAYFLIYGIKFNKRNVSFGLMILASAVALLMISDSIGLTSPSHMGRLIKDAGNNGLAVVVSTIQRKISMNLRLIRYTIWTKVLISIIIIIAFMFFRPGKQLQSLFERYSYLRYSWISIAVLSITGFAVNDSGIVVAATAMIYMAFTMLIMSMGERIES